MNIKKLLCLLTALILVFSLASCTEGGFSKKLYEAINGVEDDDGDDGTGGDPAGDDGEDGTDQFDGTVFSQGLDDSGYFEGVRALDLVTLPDYRSMAVPDFYKITDRALVDGDFVNIDYVGSVDGVEFQGGSTQGNGTDVIIGVTSYIDDFLEQLIGHTPGENFDIEVTFPENYGNEELNGKDAIFNITVNYIWNVTEEDAVAIGFSGRNELAQYVAYGSGSMAAISANALVNAVITASECSSVPDAVHNTIYTQIENMITLQAAQYGLDANTYVMYAYGAASLEDLLNSQVPAEASWDLIIQAIAEQENITVTDQDIADAGLTDYIETYGKPYVAFTLLQEKVNDLIHSVAGLVEK